MNGQSETDYIKHGGKDDTMMQFTVKRNTKVRKEKSAGKPRLFTSRYVDPMEKPHIRKTQGAYFMQP